MFINIFSLFSLDLVPVGVVKFPFDDEKFKISFY
jgi:hypothetical protein